MTREPMGLSSRIQTLVSRTYTVGGEDTSAELTVQKLSVSQVRSWLAHGSISSL